MRISFRAGALLAALAVAELTSACGGAPSAATKVQPTTTTGPTVNQWFQGRARDDFREIERLYRDASDEVIQASGYSEYADSGPCQALERAIDDLRLDLPAPDPALTAKATTALEGLTTGAKRCSAYVSLAQSADLINDPNFIQQTKSNSGSVLIQMQDNFKGLKQALHDSGLPIDPEL
jgi:hypothetical protein